jgi:hypothetical protein
MTPHKVTVEGELYLSLETYAEIYSIEVHWLRDVYDHGLLGSGVNSGSLVCVATTQMDRVATIVRLHEGYGLDVETIYLVLEDD